MNMSSLTSFSGRGQGEGQPLQGRLTSAKAGSGNSMQELWEGLHNSRLSIEQDQRDFEKARQDLETLKTKVQAAADHSTSLAKRINDTQELLALRTTELSHTEIKEKVVSESLETVDEELKSGWEDLTSSRSKAMEASNQYLKDSCNFALMWNCTDVGRMRRKGFREQELEGLKHTKQRMEYELSDYLKMVKKLEEAEAERLELLNSFEEQEELVGGREKEGYKRLQEADDLLGNSWKAEQQMVLQFEEDVQRIQTKIKETRDSVSYWERRVSESQKTLENQRAMVKPPSKSFIPSTGIPTANNGGMQKGIGNGTNRGASNSSRIYQPFRPLPFPTKVQQSAASGSNATVNAPNGPAQAVKVNLNSKFQPPPQKMLAATACKASIPQTHYSSSSNLSQSRVSLPSSTLFPSKALSSSSASNSYANNSSSNASRVFQFKKKAADGSENFPNTNSNTATVNLDQTSYSMFQNNHSAM